MLRLFVARPGFDPCGHLPSPFAGFAWTVIHFVRGRSFARARCTGPAHPCNILSREKLSSTHFITCNLLKSLLYPKLRSLCSWPVTRLIRTLASFPSSSRAFRSILSFKRFQEDILSGNISLDRMCNVVHFRLHFRIFFVLIWFVIFSASRHIGLSSHAGCALRIFVLPPSFFWARRLRPLRCPAPSCTH